MTFGLPIALNTLLMAAGIAGALTVIAYILKMRRRRFEVPFSTLWQRILKERETTSLWRHLRRFLSLLLMLFMLGLLLFASTDPALGSADDDAKNVVVIIDASASMRTEDESLERGKDGRVTRLEAAKKQALELIDSLGGGDAAMIMRMDGQTTPLSRFESDRDRLRTIVRDIRPSDTPANLRRALSAAADALRDRQNPLVVLIGDGAYPEESLNRVRWEKTDAKAKGDARPDRSESGGPAGSKGSPETRDSAEGVANRDHSSGSKGNQAKSLSEIDLSGIDVRYLPVGKASENVGIVAFNVRRYVANKMAYEVFIEVRNYGKEKARRKLVLYSGDSPVDVRTLELEAGKTMQALYPNISGGTGSRLKAVLVPLGDDPSKDDSANLDVLRHDAFPLDDEAYALLPERKRQEVLLVTSDNLYLEGAMLIYENIRVDKATPEEYDRLAGAAELGDYHAVVFDSYTPKELPPENVHLMYFDPQGEHSPFPLGRTLTRPRITDVATSHPVMQWIEMGDVNFDEVSTFRIERDKGEVALMTSVRAPVSVAARRGSRKIVALGFALPAPGRETATDIVLRVAFPLLLVNSLDWFAGDDSDLITTYTTGTRVRVPLDGVYSVQEAVVTSPAGEVTRAPVKDGTLSFYAREVGVHKVEARSPSGDGQVVAQLELAANLGNPTESDIQPSTELNLGGVTLKAPPTFEVTRSQNLWTYLVLLMAALLLVEWYTYNRRITV